MEESRPVTNSKIAQELVQVAREMMADDFPPGLSSPPSGTSLPFSIVSGFQSGELKDGTDVAEMIDEFQESFGIRNSSNIRAVWKWFNDNREKLMLLRKRRR